MVICSLIIGCQEAKLNRETSTSVPKIESVTSIVDGAFPNGINTDGIQQIVISNMNPFHVQTTYSYIDIDTEYFNNFIETINNTKWIEQTKTYDEVCNIKGKYMAVMPDELGNMRYAVMMNEITIPELSGETHGNIVIDDSDIDQSVQAYLIYQNNDMLEIYQTDNSQIYNLLSNLGDTYQVDRVADGIQVWQSQQNKNDSLAIKIKLNNTIDNIQPQTQIELETATELQNFILSIFNSEESVLSEQEDPYNQIDESEYDYGIQIHDQNNFDICTIYILKNGKIMLVDNVRGKKWNSTLEYPRAEILSYIQKINDIQMEK